MVPVFVATLLLGGALRAPASATEALRQREAEIRAALPRPGDPLSPEARRRLQGIVTRTVDLQAMARAALGARWDEMTPSQRRRLISAFGKRFRQVTGGELGDYASTRIDYGPEERVAGGVKVPTRVVVKSEPTAIAYTMRRELGGWRIVDIEVDGVSTVENYRASFARVIAKEGVEGLIRRLEKSAASRRP